MWRERWRDAVGARALTRRPVARAAQWVSTRPFASEYPSEAIGLPYEKPYTDELWLDVSNAGVRAVTLKVLDLAAAKGCDFVEPDNVQGA